MLRERGFFMALTMKITEVHAREILDSMPAIPTVEVEMTAETETTGRKTTARESGSVGSEHRKI